MPAPKPTIYLIAGCNGAGKTTFAKEYLPSIGIIRFLNADEIARGLSPLKPEVVAFKAGRVLLSELRELIDRRETFALESTLSGRTYVKFFEEAKQRGCILCGYQMCAKRFDACANESSKAAIMFQPMTFDADSGEAFNTSSMITRRRRPNGSCGITRHLRQSCWENPPLTVLLTSERSSHSMKKILLNGLKPIPESKMSPEARVASQAHKRATRKKRAELRGRGLPMIIWKDGKVREVPA